VASSFFSSPIEVVLKKLTPKKKGPDDDRIRIVDLYVEIPVPTAAFARELGNDVSELLFGSCSEMLKYAVPDIGFHTQDLFLSFEPIDDPEDILEAGTDAEYLIEGAVVTIKKIVPGDDDNPPTLHVIFTWSPSTWELNLIHEQLEEAMWLIAQDAYLSEVVPVKKSA
jgi:hypothetical protein